MTKKSKDTNKCKEWERQRRDRLNAAFDGLAQLLLFYDPAKAMTKIDILEKSTEFIKEIRLTNSRLLVDKCQPQETSKKVHQLQEEVNKLIIRVRQLTSLLKGANITIPLGPSIRLLGKKRRKWSAKLITTAQEIEIENADPNNSNNDMSPCKKPMNKKRTRAKKNGTVWRNDSTSDTASAVDSMSNSVGVHVNPAPIPNIPVPTPSTSEKENNSDSTDTEKATDKGHDSGVENPVDNFTPKESPSPTSTASPKTSSKATPTPTATTCAKLVGPLTQSNVQNVQSIMSTGMPITLNLSSSSLTPVTFTGQLAFSNLSLQQLRPTITILTSPITTCSIPQFGTSVTTMAQRTNDTNLNILPKLIVPSCSLQKIPIKCIRKPNPRKKYKPRGNSKRRLELLAKIASETEAAKAKALELEVSDVSQVSEASKSISENQMRSETKEKQDTANDQGRSPSPELIDISKDREDEVQHEASHVVEDSGLPKSGDGDISALQTTENEKHLNEVKTGENHDQIQESTELTQEKESIQSMAAVTAVNLEEPNSRLEDSATKCPEDPQTSCPPSSAPSTYGKAADTDMSATQVVSEMNATNVNVTEEFPEPCRKQTETGKDEENSMASAPIMETEHSKEQTKTSCKMVLEEDKPESFPQSQSVHADNAEAQGEELLTQPENAAPVPDLPTTCNPPTVASNTNKEKAAVTDPSDQTEKTPGKTLPVPVPVTTAHSSSELGRLLEEEDVSLSSEDKISECIARSIGLIDDHPACADLMDLSTDWGAVVNAHLAAKSPISPTQMFLSMFPLLPRDGLLGDNLFTPKSTAGLLGCGRSSFSMNSVLLEDNTISGSGTATPNNSSTIEPLTLTGVDTSSYSWAQSHLGGESSSAQSKFNSILTPQRSTKRSHEPMSTPKHAKHTREDKQNQGNEDFSYSFTALQPVSTSATSAARYLDSIDTSSSRNKRIAIPEVESINQFHSPSGASSVPTPQPQGKTTQNKRSRKSSTSKSNTKASETRQPSSSSSNALSSARSVSKNITSEATTKPSDQKAGNIRVSLQSPPVNSSQLHSSSLSSPRSLSLTSPKGKDSERESQFIPFRNVTTARGSTGLSPANQSRKRMDDNLNSPTKNCVSATSSTTTFLPPPSMTSAVFHGHPNLPFELFRPAVSTVPVAVSTSSNSTTILGGGTHSRNKSASEGFQTLSSSTSSAPRKEATHGTADSHVPQGQYQFNVSTYDESHNGAGQPLPRFTHLQGRIGTSGNSSHCNNYASTSSQNNNRMAQVFQPCDTGSLKTQSQILSSPLDVNAGTGKTGHKSSKVSQHFPFYLPESSFQKGNEGFVNISECMPQGGSNYLYQQHGITNANLSQTSHNQQPHFFVQPQLQSTSSRNSLYQPTTVSSSSAPTQPRHSHTYNQTYNSSTKPPHTAHTHTHSICTSANYFDQPSSATLPQYQPSVHQHAEHATDSNSSRPLPDVPQHCTNTENLSRFVPPPPPPPPPVFSHQRHPTVNWMTDPSGPSPNTQILEYANVTSNVMPLKKTSRNSTLGGSIHNPFSVSTLMGSNVNLIRPTNNYCTEAIVRKTVNSWSSSGTTSLVTQVSKPEVSRSGANLPNYNLPFEIQPPPHQHHPQSSPHGHSHSQFTTGSTSTSQFNYFESPTLSADPNQNMQPHYISSSSIAPTTSSSASASASHLFGQQHSCPPQLLPLPSHQLQPHHHHHCQQSSSTSTHHPSSSSSVTNFNLSTIFPEINDKRLTNTNSSGGYNANNVAGSQSSQPPQPHGSHSHSSHVQHHQAGGGGSNGGGCNQQQQQQTNANQANNNFSYFVNNLTPK